MILFQEPLPPSNESMSTNTSYQDTYVPLTKDSNQDMPAQTAKKSKGSTPR